MCKYTMCKPDDYIIIYHALVYRVDFIIGIIFKYSSITTSPLPMYLFIGEQ